MALAGKTILITGAAHRVGKAIAIAAADAGANLILHYGSSKDEAIKTLDEIKAKGVQAEIIQADLRNHDEVSKLFEDAQDVFGPIDALVNNAAIFDTLDFINTSFEEWEKHFQVNLTAPSNRKGRIINILDWRALRPSTDHFPYTISKGALATLTRSLAIALAPQIQVNGIALGAILPPSDGGNSEEIIKNVPMGRWANLKEVGDTILFLLEGPEYITGEIIHLDGGRHLV
jgi:NAD(P)-dependent dehydrogenase (short-subunit alcohol dehydrogenase family)